MRKKLRIEPQARVDLLEIWHYIANDSLEAATRLVEKLEAEIRGLLPMPGKGHARTDVRDPRLRFWPVEPYVVAYRFDKQSLTIVRVLHGHRNFRRIFKRK